MTPSGMRVSSALQVAPSAIEFRAFEADTCYVAAFSIKNTSDRILRYRLVPPPHASPFRVLYRSQDLARTSNPTVKVPPGLSMKYEVTFQVGAGDSSAQNPPLDAIFHDALQIKGDDQSFIEVPLMARKACPILDVDPSLCDLGLVVVTQRAAQYVRLRNSGARPGRFEVEVLDANGSINSGNAILVTPLRGSLAPSEASNVKIEVVGKELGVFRGIVRIRIRERSADDDDDEEEDLARGPSTDANTVFHAEKIVDVCGKVVEHNVELVLKNGLTPVKSLYFGSLFAGECKTIETVLRNNGPQLLFFKTTLAFGGSSGGAGSSSNSGAGNASLSADDEREAYERRRELQVYPAEGRVEPFADLLVTFTYHPHGVDLLKLRHLEAKHRHALDQDESNNNSNPGSTESSSTLPPPPIVLNAFASIQCADIQSQNLTFEVAGKTFLPKLEVSPSSALDFGDVKSHDRVDILLSLKNLSGLPVQYSVPKIAHFSVKPNSGRLDVLQSQSIIASFTPTQLGTFQSTMELSVNNGVLMVPIHVKGRAAAVGDVSSKPIIGGVQALPKDFVPQYKFLLPEEAKQTKGKLTRKFTRMTPYEAAALNGTAAIDEYEFEGTNSTHLTYCVKELAKRADHNAGYHEYLAACRLQREEKQRRKSATGLKQDVSNARSNNNDDDEDSSGDGFRVKDVDLGMERQGGVGPRMLRLPKELKQRSDPLWLNQSGANGGGSKSKAFFDDNKFVKKKFKPQPATQAEIADCALNLDFDQLEQILSGPKTLHLGKLSVNGVAKKSLSVQNNLAHNIVVDLHLRDEDHLEELARHTPLKSQVVPPRTLAGFDLVFSSSKEQFFQKQLGFSINGVHKREITVVAEVAPIVVELSTDELRFEFSYMDTSPSMTLEVALTNTSDSVAPFQWSATKSPGGLNTRPGSSKSNVAATATLEKSSSLVSAGGAGVGAAPAKPVFEVFPPNGSLNPAATLTCQVVYTPPSAGPALQQYSLTPDKNGRGSWIAGSFQLDITGGKRVALGCKALVEDLKVTAKEKKVDFGTISVGIEREKKITLMNATADTSSFGSSSWATFYASIEPAPMASSLGLVVSPSVGTILSQETSDIVVKIFPHKPVALDSSVTLHVQIRGGKSLKIPIMASVLLPEVYITPQSSIAFDEVVLGVSVPRVVTLENRSTIPACLFLDLATSLSDEFAVVMPPKLLARLEDVSSVFIPMIESKAEKDIVPTGEKGSTSAGATTLESSGAEADTLCSKWQICIPPNTTVSFHLTFTPKRPGTHEQLLPIQIAGVSSSNAIARPESITRRVTATAIAPRLRFSSAVLDFHRCVITREGIRKVPYTKLLVLTNNDSKTVKWQIDTSQLKQVQMANPAAAKRAGHTSSASASSVIFHLAPEKGELAPNEEVKIRINFLPLDAVEYVEEEIPLLLDDQFYIHISVKGEGIHPHLSFSENKLILPTVPLGIVSRATLFIQSTGYDHLDLTYRIPLDLTKAPVTLHFPKGKILSMACPKIPVEVRFCSKKSVAFNARIEFFDADGSVFYLPIGGCAENCVLTNFPFLRSIGIDQDGSSRRGDARECENPGFQVPGTGSGESKSSISKKPSLPEHLDSAKFSFYSHGSMRFPIYLLSNKQIEAEVNKEKLQQEQASGQQQQANGFVDVDSSGGIEDDNASLSRSLPLLHGEPTAISSSAAQFGEREIAFLLQYLNTNFLRNPVTKFPHDLADTWGKPLYELLEMVCTKKPSGGGVMPAMKTGKGSGAAGLQPSKKDLLAHFTLQYSELLKFLKSYGAMLHDVPPQHLLSQEYYVRACEDPRADPSILSSPTLIHMRFVQRRHVLEREWQTVSSNAWMKVLYQAIKCFLLYRITSKGYNQQQQQTKTDIAARACQGSNVYSESEMVLVQWICDHVKSRLPSNGEKGRQNVFVETQLLDIRRDLLDGKFLFHLVASHIPTLTTEQSEYQCFRLEMAAQRKRPMSASQMQSNAQVLLQTLSSCGVDFGIDPAVFLLDMNIREMTVFLLHLNQTLPQFIPKATIEFKGILGQVMEKSIELKNPSSRALRYQVFLDGTDSGSSGGAAGTNTFSIESNNVVLEPGKTVAFVVTFRPRFSRKVTARLVFQSIRELSSFTSSSGATMVFLLESNIVSRKPVRVIQIEANTYEKKIEEIVIENQFPTQAAYKLFMTQQQQGSSFALSPGGVPGSVPHHATAGQGRRRSVQGKDTDRPNAPMSALNQSSASFAGPVSKKNALQMGRSREDTDFSWCMCVQQPFFLPEFGSSGSSASASGDLGSQTQAMAGLGVLSIRSQGSTTVKLEFLPLLPGTYKCQLLFLDEKIGEFMYEIHALAHLPASLDTLKFQCETAAGTTSASNAANRFHFFRELIVPVKNPLLTRALASFIERSSGHMKTKLKEGLKRCEDTHHTSYQVEFNSPFFTSVHQEMALSSAANGAKYAKGGSSSLLVSDSDPSTARTDVSSSDQSGGAGATPTAATKAPVKANQACLLTPRSNNAAVISPNSVLIDFQPKGAGVYTCKLLLRSHHTVCGSSDLRVYDLEAKVKEPNVKTLLEFAAPARHSIVQEIPLSNPSDAPWTLKATFSNSTSSSGGSMFSGPSALQVPAKKSVNYPLTFSPKWISDEKSSFTLVNPSTQQQFEFELSGYGEEPLAQDHVVLSCQARTSIVHEFEVASFKTDPPGAQQYRVESDLRDVKGAPSVTVPAPVCSSVKYPLTFSPIVSGTYFGSITFTNEATKEYIWYTIEANVSPPEPETTLDMRAVVRGAVGVEISLANPLDHAVTFAVELQGEGLLGPASLSLEAQESGVYALVYSPLMATSGASTGSNGEEKLAAAQEGAILFSNDEIGQFWYRLHLSASAAPPQEMEDMCCAVGDVCSQPILLQNPSDRELLLQYKVTNARNFSIKGREEASSSPGKAHNRASGRFSSSPRVILPPFGQATVIVEYTPSSLSDYESTSIVFFEPDVVSDWEFLVKGIGKAPSVMKPIVVSAKVHEAASTLFTFKNPFADVLRVEVKLVTDESESSARQYGGTAGEKSRQVFDILLKKSRVQMESFGHLQVPISFIPQFVCEARAEIVIHGSEEYGELEWRYPIHGIAEAPLHPRPFTFACQARDSVEKKIVCELLAAPPDMMPSEESFSVEWEIPAERFGALASAAAVERSLGVTALPVVGEAGPQSSIFAPYQVRFDPLRAYRGSIYLLIKKKSGGLWRFEVIVDVSDPPVDDVITIESNLNQTSSITFQLRNQFRQSAHFLAEFSAGSSSAFTVYPAEGSLPPYGSNDGMPFVVSFTPTGYGKMQSGQLVILTEEMQWTFNVKGTYPDATSSKGSGPSSSVSSSASRYRLGIASGDGNTASLSSASSKSPSGSPRTGQRSRARPKK